MVSTVVWHVMCWDGISMAAMVDAVVLTMGEVLWLMVDSMVVLKILMVGIVVGVIEVGR